jgi:tetratricopeptide (TPR) repeat protein
MAGHSPSFVAVLLAVILLLAPSDSYMIKSRYGYSLQRSTTTTASFTSTPHPRVSLGMVMALPDKDTAAWSNSKEVSLDKFSQASPNDNTSENNKKRKVRKKYQRKRIPETEKEHIRLRRIRQAEYDHITYNNKVPSVWSFERLFPQPVWDEETIKKDLYESKLRDKAVERAKLERQQPKSTTMRSKLKTSAIGASSMLRVWRDPKLSSYILPYDPPPKKIWDEQDVDEDLLRDNVYEPISTAPNTSINGGDLQTSLSERLAAKAVNETASNGKVDLELTRMVEDKLYGMRRGSSTYDSSLMGEGAIKFRDGVRLGNPLPVNAARLNYQAKKELRHDRVEEAQELYEIAVQIDPRDGRAYLGLSRCAERRRDFKLARAFLKAGIANAVSSNEKGDPDRGANPFLLQALGVLEEKSGHLAQAEALYIEAAKSRNYHAAAWVALAQLRTHKFRQGAAAGRVCYQTAERELEKAGMPPSSHVYTAWASLEYKKAGDVRRSRQLFKAALTVDPKCSAAWLQLGVMESNNGNFNEAELCFETVLKFDQRNSRVLQAYAIMETKRPDSNSRKVIGLFERALKANPRDAGVLQPYALYVGDLGDIDAARDL